MGMIIDIEKIEENKDKAIYHFRTYDNGYTGKVSISKTDKEFFILEEPEWDKEHKLAYRVGAKLIQHWHKGEFPDVTRWVS